MTYRRRCRECPTVIAHDRLGELLRQLHEHQHQNWSREDDKRDPLEGIGLGSELPRAARELTRPPNNNGTRKGDERR